MYPKGPDFLLQTQIQTTNYGLPPKWYNTDKKEWSNIDILLIYTLWYEFLKDFDAQSDFGKNFIREKLVP